MTDWFKLVKIRESQGYKITPRKFATLASVNIVVTHSCGHSWSPVGPRFLKGITNCPKCSHPSTRKTTDEFITDSKIIWGDKYDYSKVHYVNSKESIELICKEHNKSFLQTPDNHLNGRLNGCPDCAKALQKNSSKLHHELNTLKTGKQYKEIFEYIHKNTYENYSLLDRTLYKTSDEMTYTCKKHGKIVQSIHNHLQGKGCNRCKGQSKAEQGILELISENYSGEMQVKARRILPSGKELDIYLPGLNIAIEYNGTYWHSELHKESNYHLDKTNECNQLGIQLIHIWEYEYLENPGAYHNYILAKIGKTIPIFGRNTYVLMISPVKAREFLSEYHIQGADKGSTLYYGVFTLEDELVMVGSFGKPRFDSKREWELIRVATKAGYRVVGGASKILSQFEINVKPKSLVSYANYSRSNGDLYKALGFNLSHISAPGWRVHFNQLGTLTRYQTQKHLLHNLLEDFDEDLTALENIHNHGGFRIYDCGQMVFIKDYIYILENQFK